MYKGFTSTGRLIYVDSTSTTSFDVRSTNLSGGDNRTLLAGCTGSPIMQISAKGVLVNCTIGGVASIWASDGIASAISLPGTTGMLAFDYFPEGAILASLGHLYTEPVDGSAGPIVLSPEATDQGDTYYSGITGTGDQVLFASHVNTEFHLWSMNADGSLRGPRPRKAEAYRA